MKAKSEKGKYFRNSVWYWRPLWDYVSIVCDDILSLEDKDNGSFNDGHILDSEKASKIAKRLFDELKNKGVERYEQEY